MPKRGPTDTDRQNGEGDVEVVNAAGERKPASLPKRLLAAARDTVSMTDEQADPAWPAQIGADDQTIVTGNPAVAPEQPPQATLVARRGQHSAKITRVADQIGERVAQLVDMDRKARYRVYDIGRIVALLALGNEALTQLEVDGWAVVTPQLIGEFEREIDGWKADRGIA